MGTFPTESRDVQGLSGDDYPPYKVPPHCSAPGCTKWADHGHHLFSRGKMGGAYDYVRVPDGTEIGNLIPLCYIHHQNVTDNIVHITYSEGKFFWDGIPLMYQPPTIKRGDIMGLVSSGDDQNEHDHTKHVCPGCGRRMPRPKIDGPVEERKKRKTWSVMVPDTEQEDGADTIDALLEAAREEMDKYGLSWGEGRRVKFFLLTTALALFVQHAEEVLGDS